jgi:hypothetical protein
MRRTRPCRICGRWFRVHPRVGQRQRVCSTPACQRERHRRACLAWHRRNPDYDREVRLQRRLRCPPPSETPSSSLRAAPMRQLDWSVARDVVGLEVAVVVEESAKVLCHWARDAVAAQTAASEKVSARHLPDPARDEIAKGPRSP